MSNEEKVKSGGFGDPHQHQYGTFQGTPISCPQPQPVIGFPHPVPPPGSSAASAPPYHLHHHHHQQGYQAIPVVEGTPVRERRLPCCGMGLGWFLFIIGFFLAGIPWYVGALILICSRVDYREKPGLVVCSIAAVLDFVAVVVGVTKVSHAW